MIVELTKTLAWPVAFVIAILILKKPLSMLLTSTKGIEYTKGKNGHRFKAQFSEKVEESKESLEIENNPDPTIELEDPKQSILDAWNSLEATAQQKLAEIDISDLNKSFLNKESRALDYMVYKGTFSPKIESVIQDMGMLRNEIAHYGSDVISSEDAQSYVQVIQEIEKFINALQTLPAIHLSAITMIVLALTNIIDDDKHRDVTIEVVHQYIENGTVLEFITSFESASSLKGLMESDTYKEAGEFYVQSLQSIYGGYAGNERRKWGIEHSGICLLLAWTNEIIQMGSGWHPDTHLSEIGEKFIQ